MSRGSIATARRHAVEKPLGRAARNDGVRHGICVALERVTGCIETARRCAPSSLLNNVGRFMCRGVKIWRAGEPDAVALRVCRCADSAGCLLRRTANLRTYAAHIVPPERSLNCFEVRDRVMGSGEPIACYHLGKVRTWSWATNALSLHGGTSASARTVAHRPRSVEVAPQPSFIAGSSSIISEVGRRDSFLSCVAGLLGERALRPVHLLEARHES